MEPIKQFVLDTIRLFVDHPSEVEINCKEDSESNIVTINVKVAKNDVGVCIGNEGTTAEALRKIIGLVGFKQCGKRVYMKIDAPKIPKNHFYPEK